jgi:hypothetical protein
MEMARLHKQQLENEWYHVRHSGEIPEIALHSSIYYLTEDSDGPGLVLTREDHSLLLDAAMARYLEIIIRDILPENRDTPMYRGVLRTICNWRRLKRFCGRHQLNQAAYTKEISDKFISFLENEVKEVTNGHRSSCINCNFEELSSFAVELGVSLADLQDDLEKLCINI